MTNKKQPENVTTLLEPEKGEPIIWYSEVNGTPFRFPVTIVLFFRLILPLGRGNHLRVCCLIVPRVV